MVAGPFVLTLWTNDPELAGRADRAGIDRVGLDLETLGKRARQPTELGTWVSEHRVEQVPAVGAALTRAALYVRTNPLHPKLDAEVEQLLGMGVDVLMFPNFQDVAEIEAFSRIVKGRAKIVPLVERLKAAQQIERIAALNAFEEIHVGLNDLSLDLGLPHRMALLVSEMLADIASVVTGAGKRLGLGGLGRAGDVNLPIPSDLVYAQYPRLGATAALIAQVFAARSLSAKELADEVARLRERMQYWFARDPEGLDAAHKALQAHLATLH